jgi:glutathione S-transferase
MQRACHVITTEVATTTSAQYISTINQFGQSKVLHLLGPPWARTFRCVWMLEELNDERKNSSPTTTDTGVNSVNNSLSTSLPYYLVQNATPLSKFVKRFHPTGKVPVLLEYRNQQTISASAVNDRSASLDAFSNTTTIDENDVFVLSEASAINTYLYDQYGVQNARFNIQDEAASTSDSASSFPLVPPVGSPLRGQYDALVSCICTELDAQGLWIHRKHETMAEQLTQQRPNQRAVVHAREHFRRINQYLAYLCNPYLLGQHFTAVDILYVHCLDWSKAIGWSDLWPRVTIAPPINHDFIKEQRKKNESSAAEVQQDTLSILHPYIDLCHSRPAYQRALQIRDGNTNRDTKITISAALTKHSKL